MSTRRRSPFVPRQRRKRKVAFPLKLTGIVIAALILTFVVGYFVAVRLLFPPLPEPENGIAVPSLKGLSIAEAEDRLRQLSLRLVATTDIAHPTERAGIIIAQSPLAGQQLRDAGAVRVAVSAGPPRVPVPNVIGFSAERASSALGAVGFAVDRQVGDSDEPEGTVIRTLPAPGTDLAVPGRVVIIVSSGPPLEPEADTLETTVPADTIGM